MKKKECLAMLLAGGQGSRLYALTQDNAKPAVSFGGKYRIIDFSLSNCCNSGIDTVGVLVQYRPLVLNRYLGTGKAWDLDVNDGGVHVLPPFATQTGGAWYEGTADSIYHNIDFIDSYNPKYVLILSGDHLYKFDYNKMLDVHKERKADLTIAVREVPWEDASRFGIMTTNENDNIVKFDEKPEHPESNLASMGIYIFTWKELRRALLEDHVDNNTEHDFGKNIIPKLLFEKKNLVAYHYDGYWKDVGTIDSYYEAQMELLKDDDEREFDLNDPNFRIMSNSSVHPPHYVGKNGIIENSMICNACEIYGEVKNCIVSSGAVIEEGAVVEDSILLPNSIVRSGTHIKRAIVGEDIIVKGDISIGSEDGEIAVIGIDSIEAEGKGE